MSNSIFRKSTVDRMNSPEQLNEYIRVARPGVWLVLGAIILLLVGVIIWSIAGTVTTVVNAAVFVDDEGMIQCIVRAGDAADVEPGMPITIGDVGQGVVLSVSEETFEATREDSYMLQFAGISEGDICYTLELEAEGLELGIYKGEIEVERIRPISFVTQ